MSNAIGRATKILWYAALAALLFSFIWYVSSCARCPKPPVIPPTVVEKTCDLPPVPVLPVAQTVSGCDPKLFCYDAEGALAVVERDGKLRQWVREVVARCGGRPAANPTEKPDAGSADQAY